MNITYIHRIVLISHNSVSYHTNISIYKNAFYIISVLYLGMLKEVFPPSPILVKFMTTKVFYKLQVFQLHIYDEVYEPAH